MKLKKIIRDLIHKIPIVKSLDNILDKLKQEIKDLKKLLKVQKKEIASLSKLLNKQETYIENHKVELNELRRKLVEKDQQIVSLQKSTDELRKQINLQNDELRKQISLQNDELKKQVELLNSDTKELEKQSHLTNTELKKSIEKSNKSLEYWKLNLQRNIRWKYFQGLHRSDYKRALQEWYYETCGEVINIDEPHTINEKIQWIKLYLAESDEYTRLADKYLVREWVAQKIGEEYLVPLLGVWDSFEQIDFESLPESFVLKANHGCGYNVVVSDKSKFDYAHTRKLFAQWMKENFAWNSLELQYKNISKKIIAEQYIENSELNLNDYKIYCFNGKPKYIQFLTDRHSELKMAFYDLDWNLMPFVSIAAYTRYTEPVNKPTQLDTMLELAEKLAEGFPFVRVDFYILNDGSILFGEMTFTPASGANSWEPKEYNRILGDEISL